MTTVRKAHDGAIDEPAAIAAALRSAGHTVGSTRRAIIEAIRAREDSFTAEGLAAELDGVHPATVYRSLALLEEIGMVQHVHLSHGAARYERTVLAGTQRHLVCDVCGRHLSVPASVFDTAARRLRRDWGFELDGSHFAIVGRCTACADSPAPH